MSLKELTRRELPSAIVTLLWKIRRATQGCLNYWISTPNKYEQAFREILNLCNDYKIKKKRGGLLSLNLDVISEIRPPCSTPRKWDKDYYKHLGNLLDNIELLRYLVGYL